ncbi:unnamed protein product [Trichogramma brassicae]|uniref:RNA-directed DNA polymerase n=1 Tax=Trichogramma brassicae TaxID=86971 RepID=A0A6H5J9T9_9HYME|nr:unnamed protein product [Trichogramma brassicae]
MSRATARISPTHKKRVKWDDAQRNLKNRRIPAHWTEATRAQSKRWKYVRLLREKYRSEILGHQRAVEAVLVDEAAVWYESVEHKVKTWQDFERRFRRSFASQATTDELLTELRQRTQGKGEPISTYLNNFRFLCSRFRVPLPYENQLAIAFRGKFTYRALMDSGAQCCLAGPKMMQDLADRIRPSPTVIGFANSQDESSSGCLPVMLQVDREAGRVVLECVEILPVEMVLGADFGRRWKVDIGMGRDQWRSNDGPWHDFARPSDTKMRNYAITAECAGITVKPSERERACTSTGDAFDTGRIGRAGLYGTRLSIKIELIEGARPVCQRARRMSDKMEKIAIEHVSKMLREGIIEEACSEWNSVRHSGAGETGLLEGVLNTKTDASDYAVGAVLTQEYEDGEHPVYYVSRVLSRAEQRYTTTEKECLAVIWAIEKFRPYVEGSRFKVVTDHRALTWLRNFKDPQGRVARWALKLMEYDFEIVYRKGSVHYVPDALSRAFDKEVCAFEKIEDEWYLKKRLDVQREPSKFKDWTIEDGMLYKRGRSALLDPVTNAENGWRLVVPAERRQRVLFDAHSLTSSGHLGAKKTYDRAACEYWWPGMWYDLEKFCSACEVCQRYKVPQTGPTGLMTRRVVDRPWVVVAADMMEFPRSKNQNKYLLVFQDLFTR